ncbi:CUB-like domain-containing protein [Caenorhabditis elegans]|uniref:CUB-like domain-containing protein n=1 Tax=Caenorhabditis elegans TaxID=6239 RepID=O02341_CAEEL|nr:CUB-like domain-containing protein [Caenorhabditis elegans]CAB05322.2 CUB-like domain-containing protein [Caenorhabditis elegans]|eukprot:NP_502452.2 Uncharacterized protein CELE_ZK896.1 [Caenorhabditis elegans]
MNMTIFIVFVICLSCVSLSLGTETCPPLTTIKPPDDIQKSLFYPSNWNDDLPTPNFAAGQKCSFKVIVPNRMFAQVFLTVSVDSTSSFTVTDSANYTTQITSAKKELFFWMDPSATLSLQANHVAVFGMKITWNTIGPVVPQIRTVHAKSPPLALNAMSSTNPIVVKSDTHVSFLPIPQNYNYLDPILRSVQVYDGPTIDSTHLGTLYQAIASNNSLVSSGKYLTFYSLSWYYSVRNIVILQDYSDIQNYASYQAFTCHNSCGVSLDASKGTAAVLLFNSLSFVNQLSMSDNNSTLSVYTNSISDDNKLSDYSYSNSQTNIPQKFVGNYTIFVLDKGQANLSLKTYTPNNAWWSYVFYGQRGFFASPNFGTSDSDQNLCDAVSINGKHPAKITYTVDRSAIVGPAVLTVSIGGNITIYDVTNLPGPDPISAIGMSIAVNYESNGVISTGAFVSFEFQKSATSNGILFTIVLTICMAIFF